jgi:hypothetical protein
VSHYFHITDSKTMGLTPELAREFDEMPATVTERDLDQKRLKYLRESILSGRAIPFQWSKAKVNGSTDVIRINGHHSSHVLNEMNGEFPEGLIAHIDTYEVDTIEHLPVLFKQFDSRHSARSLGDISGAYQSVVPALAGLSKGAARKAIEAVSWFERKIVGTPVPSGDDVYDLFFQAAYHPFINMACSIVSIKTPEFNTQVLAAMFGTHETSPTESESFWKAVALQGDGNAEDHPATVLDTWLLDAREAEQKPSQMEVYRACVIAWNRYRNHQSLDRIGKFDPKKGAPEIE